MSFGIIFVSWVSAYLLLIVVLTPSLYTARAISIKNVLTSKFKVVKSIIALITRLM